MSCSVCEVAVVGKVYSFTGRAVCNRCKSPVDSSAGSYLGMIGSDHKFRVLPRSKCPSCGMSIRYATIKCEDPGIDVTEEFESIRHPHWVGKAG